MNDGLQRDDQLDSSVSIKPEKTPFVVGPGIVIKGNVVSELDDPDVRMLVLGRIEGDISTKGIVQIAKGAVVAGNSLIQAGSIIVSGSICGDEVTVRAQLLVLQSTGRVTVGSVRLPPGGLEQQRGSVLEARLHMSEATFSPSDVPTEPKTHVVGDTSAHVNPAGANGHEPVIDATAHLTSTAIAG
ncbi:MAG: polymer-forming cytoskeletal protein [Pseudomonadota bacterium]